MDGRAHDKFSQPSSSEAYRDDVDGDIELDHRLHDQDPWVARSYDDNLDTRPTRFHDTLAACFAPWTEFTVILVAAIFFVALIGLIVYQNRDHIVYLLSPNNRAAIALGESLVVWNNAWEKPKDFKIVALIFYGRPHTVDVLDCYLQQNMVANNGYLDEVHFMQHTDRQKDIDWLKNLVASRPGYLIIDEANVTKTCDADGKCSPTPYANMWKHATDINTLYLKIDDDVVYIEKNAIPSIVHTRLRHPEAFVIFANVVNNALSAFGQYIMGAYQAYLPEPIEQSGEKPKFNGSWRASDLPTYPDIKIADTFDEKSMHVTEGYRWLPLRDNSSNALRKTPIGDGPGYDPHDVAWKSGAIAAQAHYSLLQNIEDDRLDKYWYINAATGIWDVHQTQYSVNFIAIWGSDVAANPVSGSDEVFLTVHQPKVLNRPTLADSKSVVAHLHYNFQSGTVMKTDLIDRYIAYANEYVCAADNQKSRIT